jgi:hypothetical protein
MPRKLPTQASRLLGAASAPAVVQAFHPWSPAAGAALPLLVKRSHQPRAQRRPVEVWINRPRTRATELCASTQISHMWRELQPCREIPSGLRLRNAFAPSLSSGH